MKLTAKEIIRQIEMNLLRGRDEKLNENLIVDYAKQKVKERDEQWFDTMIELGYLTDTDLVDEVNASLPEIKFE